MISRLLQIVFYVVVDLCVFLSLSDIQLVDTDTHSYQNQAPLAVLSSAEHNKKKYSQACQDQRTTFTSLCMSIDSTMGNELHCTAFLQQNSDLLSKKWTMV